MHSFSVGECVIQSFSHSVGESAELLGRKYLTLPPHPWKIRASFTVHQTVSRSFRDLLNDLAIFERTNCMLLRTRMASFISLAEIPTLSALYKLNRLRPTNAPNPKSTPNQLVNEKISLIRNDITKLRVDSIVNAANESLLGGGGVDGAIHRAAGRGLVRECRKLDGCDTGYAKITDAYELPCKKVIHAVGPVYHITKERGQHTSLLQGCYRRSLELAVENGLKSIAFSALSTGVYGYPSGEAAETAIAEVKRFLQSQQGEKLERVVFCSFEQKDEKAYEDWIP